MIRTSSPSRTILRGLFLGAVVLLSIGVLIEPAFAQTGRMQGRITDPEGNGLGGVSIVATNPSATPGQFNGEGTENGQWVIVGFSRGNWTFTFTKEGYVAFEVTATVSAANRNANLDVILYPTPEGAGASGAGAGAEQPELFNDGTAMYDAGDYSGAVAKWEEFATLNPEMYQVQGNIGNAYRELGDMAKAREAYEALIAQEPANTMANYNVGEMLVADGDIEGAMPYFENVLQAAPDDPAVYYNVAELYFSQREMESAVLYYKRAIEVDANYLPAHMQLGFAYVNSGDLPNAILAFEKYVEIAPEDDPQLPIVKDVLAALKSG